MFYILAEAVEHGVEDDALHSGSPKVSALFVLYELSETVRDILANGRLLTADWPEEELAEYLAGYLSGLAFLMVGWL